LAFEGKTKDRKMRIIKLKMTNLYIIELHN